MHDILQPQEAVASSGSRGHLLGLSASEERHTGVHQLTPHPVVKGPGMQQTGKHPAKNVGAGSMAMERLMTSAQQVWQPQGSCRTMLHGISDILTLRNM